MAGRLPAIAPAGLAAHRAEQGEHRLLLADRLAASGLDGTLAQRLVEHPEGQGRKHAREHERVAELAVEQLDIALRRLFEARRPRHFELSATLEQEPAAFIELRDLGHDRSPVV